MTDKEYVKQYFPHSYFQISNFGTEIWNGEDLDVIIGEGGSAKEAWSDAKKWIDELPQDQKPKIKSIN